MGIRLTCTRGAQAGESFTFDEPVIQIGRDPRCDLLLDPAKEPQVSGNHCEVFEQDGKLFVRDRGSLNGTLVDGQKINAPAILRSGMSIQLGEKGPLFVVEITAAEVLAPARAQAPAPLPPKVLTPAPERPAPPPVMENPAAPSPGVEAREEVVPPGKRAIGLVTFQKGLAKAKREFRQEYSRKTQSLAAMLGAGVMLVLVVAGILYFVNRERIEETNRRTEEVGGEVDKLELKIARDETELREKLAAMGRDIQEKERSAQALAAKLEKDTGLGAADRERLTKELESERAGLAQLRGNFDDYQRKNDAMLQKMMAPFKDVAQSYQNCVYCVVTFREDKGKVWCTGLATAFALSADPGVLGTNAHVTKAVEEVLKRPNPAVFVRCSSSPRHTYRVARAFSHPGYREGPSADVGLLEVDLVVDGQRQPLPGCIHPANDEVLDAVSQGDAVAIMGFPGFDADAYLRADGKTNVAKLQVGIVSQTTSFEKVPIKGRLFEMLEHTCPSLPGNSGSPVVDIKGRVLALNSFGRLDILGGEPKAPVLVKVPFSYAINVRLLRELLRQRYPAIVWQ